MTLPFSGNCRSTGQAEQPAWRRPRKTEGEIFPRFHGCFRIKSSAQCLYFHRGNISLLGFLFRLEWGYSLTQYGKLMVRVMQSWELLQNAGTKLQIQSILTIMKRFYSQLNFFMFVWNHPEKNSVLGKTKRLKTVSGMFKIFSKLWSLHFFFDLPNFIQQHFHASEKWRNPTSNNCISTKK